DLDRVDPAFGGGSRQLGGPGDAGRRPVQDELQVRPPRGERRSHPAAPPPVSAPPPAEGPSSGAGRRVSGWLSCAGPTAARRRFASSTTLASARAASRGSALPITCDATATP